MPKIQKLNLRALIDGISDFHNLTLPILEPDLDGQSINTPQFHWDLYNDFLSGDRLLLAVAPVGFAKSTILKIYGCYEFLQNAEPYILYVSSTSTKATQQFGGIKKIIEAPFMTAIYEYEVEKTNESELIIKYKNGRKAKFEAIASGADISGINFEGQRPTIILVDDIEELDQARSIERTDKLQEWLMTTLVSRFPSLTTGKLRMINTVLTIDSLTNRILGKSPNHKDKSMFSDWATRFYQAIVDKKSIWEAMHPTKSLVKEQALRPLTFARNYMNEPVDNSNSLVQHDDLRYYRHMDLEKFDYLVMHADTTHTGKSTSDFFSLVVLGQHKESNNFYVIDFILEKLDVEKQAHKSIQMFQKYQDQVDKFTYDEKANQGFGFWVKDLASRQYNISLPIEELKYPNDKISHFEPHQPHFIANRVYLPNNHPQLDEAVTQLTSFPSKNVNDDFVDGLSGVLDNYNEDSFYFSIT